MRLPLFGDQIVSSSDLNRRSGEVLRAAAVHPVTVARAEGDLVIMQRSMATSLVRAATDLPATVRALARVVRRSGSGSGEEPDWVLALAAPELQQFASELVSALEGTRPWSKSLDEARAVLHEWSESVQWSHDPMVSAAVGEADAAFTRGEGVPAGPEEEPGLPDPS